MANSSKKALSQIDLFSGAGGLSFGFGQVGFHTIYATDIDNDSCKSFKLNHPNSIVECKDILTLDPKVLQESLNLKRGALDVLVGGPPCQGFSTYGKRDPNDSRNKLYKYYLSFLNMLYPKTFIIENVVGILSMNNGEIIEDIFKSVKDIGYDVELRVLDVSEYGIPQIRKRVFIIGNRLNKKIHFPVPTNGKQEKNDFFNILNPLLTVKDAISDLPEDVFLPSEMDSQTDYKTEYQNEYQKYMRGNLEKVISHSSKRMMGIRRLRLLLLKPGDYGNELRARIEQSGLPENFIEAFFCQSSEDAFEGCRNQDKLKEKTIE
jgi:DNA (cytosine-5)-methyltransferase 1